MTWADFQFRRRQDLGLSLRAFAAKVGHNHATAHRLEEGRSLPSIAEAEIYAEALGVSVQTALIEMGVPSQVFEPRPLPPHLSRALRDLAEPYLEQLDLTARALLTLQDEERPPLSPEGQTSSRTE